jgi:hypothetical protein
VPLSWAQLLARQCVWVVGISVGTLYMFPYSSGRVFSPLFELSGVSVVTDPHYAVSSKLPDLGFLRYSQILIHHYASELLPSWEAPRS